MAKAKNILPDNSPKVKPRSAVSSSRRDPLDIPSICFSGDSLVHDMVPEVELSQV